MSVDDFWEAQWRDVKFVYDLQQRYQCPVFHAGDLFHHWKPSPQLLTETLVNIPMMFYTVYGQHDLPQHNLELAKKSGIYTLVAAELIEVLSECSWGQTPDKGSFFVTLPRIKDKELEKVVRSVDFMMGENIDDESVYENTYEILVWHKFTYQGKEPWPGCTDPKAAKLLRQYPQFDLIVTGDNHTPFVETYEGRLLVNPGCLNQQDADQFDFKPRVYLWHAEDNTVTLVYLPIEAGVVSREHIEIVKQRNDRIEAFISRLNLDDLTTISFEENLKRFAQINEVR